MPIHAVIDATDDPDVPAAAVRLVEPGGRVVCIGLAGSPSRIDTRDLTFRRHHRGRDPGRFPGLAPAIEHYADGRVDPTPLVGLTVGLDDAVGVLDGSIRGESGPKVQVDPRR